MPLIKKNFNRLKGLLSKEQTQILETAFLLMLPALLTKVSGQFFNLMLASYYGNDDPRLNNFFVANAIPELLTSILMVGAVGTVVIPILIDVKSKEGEKKFFNVYSSILNISILAFIFMSVFIMVFAYELIDIAIKLIGVEVDVTQKSSIAWMMRALIGPQLLLGISVFISSGLNVYNRFLLPQISPLLFNIGRIIVVIALIPYMDRSPWALVAAVYLGAILHLAIQIPLFRKLRIHYKPVLLWKDKYIGEVIKLGLPRIAVLGSDQIGLMINTWLAYAFAGGTAAFYFAKSLYLVIPSIFGYTFSYASYPTVSKFFAHQELDKIRTLVHKTLNEIIFLSLPFVITLMVLRVPLVRLLFGIFPNTNFTLDNTYQVAWIMLWFSFGLIFITARWFMFSLFYASKDTFKPFVVSAVSLVSVIVLSILFTNLFSHNQNYAVSSINFSLDNFSERATSKAGVGGISLAMSVVYSIEFFVMIFVFDRTKVKLNLLKLFTDFNKKFIAGGIMGIVMYMTYKTWNVLTYTLPENHSGFIGSTTMNLFFLTAVTVIPAFMVYFLISLLLRVEELKILSKYLNPIFRYGGLAIK